MHAQERWYPAAADGGLEEDELAFGTDSSFLDGHEDVNHDEGQHKRSEVFGEQEFEGSGEDHVCDDMLEQYHQTWICDGTVGDGALVRHHVVYGCKYLKRGCVCETDEEGGVAEVAKVVGWVGETGRSESRKDDTRSSTWHAKVGPGNGRRVSPEIKRRNLFSCAAMLVKDGTDLSPPGRTTRRSARPFVRLKPSGNINSPRFLWTLMILMDIF